MHKYSVCIPVRNEESTIGPLLDDIFTHQMNPPERVLVCVNGSSDATGAIVGEYARRYRGIIPLSSIPGKANAWNACIQRLDKEGLTEDIMVFCDGDIRLGDSETLSRLVQNTRESTNILVGASVLQLPTHNKPYRLKSPSGQLYAIKPEVLLILERLFGGKMPGDIINEDLFLTLLCIDQFEVLEDVYFCCAAPSFGDYIITQLRILKGIKQLIDRNMSQEIDTLIEYILASYDNRHIWRVFRYKVLIPFLAKIVSMKPDEHIWTITQSTKRVV